jgi:hypothetical protein
VGLCTVAATLVSMKRVRYVASALRSDTAGCDMSPLASTELQDRHEVDKANCLLYCVISAVAVTLMLEFLV